MAKAVRLEKSKVDTLVSKLRHLRSSLKQIEEDNRVVFDEYRSAKDEVEGVEQSLRVEARKGVGPGESKVVYEGPDLSVIVAGPSCPISYRPEVLKKCVTRDVWERVSSVYVDTKAVNELVLSGKLKVEDLKDAVVMGPPPTARVTIK